MNNTMKKIAAILVALVMLAALVSCGSEKSSGDFWGQDEEKTETEKKTEDTKKSFVTEKETETEEETEKETEPETEADTEAETEKDTDDDGRYHFEGLSIILPEGFTVNDAAGGAKNAVPPDYPAHSDNITFSVIPGDMSTVSDEEFEEAFESQVKSIGSISDFEAERGEIPGAKVVIFTYNMTASGVEMQQANCMFIFDGKTVDVVFTYVTDDYYDAFEEAADSIMID